MSQPEVGRRWIVAGLALSLCIGLSGLNPAGAQVRAAGMAGAHLAAASGSQAPLWNPANLAQYEDRGVEILALHGTVGNDSYSLADYREFNGAFWGQAEKQALLERIESSAIRFDATAVASACGVALGDWALSSATHVRSRLALPREYVRLVLYGNDVGETFALDGAEGVGMAYSELRLSAARRLGELWPAAGPRVREWSAGVSAKYLQGWAYGEIISAEGGVTTTTEEISGSGSLLSRTARGGRGLALDLGLAGPIGRGWVASLAARDLLGRLRWDEGAEERADEFTVAGLTMDEVTDETVATSTTTRPSAGFVQRLPVSCGLGFARQSERLLITGDLLLAGEDPCGGCARARAAVGAEWRALRFLALRAGASLGGREQGTAAAGAGFTLGPVQVDLAVDSWGSMNPFASKGLGVGLGLALVL